VWGGGGDEVAAGGFGLQIGYSHAHHAEQQARNGMFVPALAVDPQSGLCWAGTEEGVVVIVR
jgi:hypothetical protein